MQEKIRRGRGYASREMRGGPIRSLKTPEQKVMYKLGTSTLGQIQSWMILTISNS
jgi:hypothetical protein